MKKLTTLAALLAMLLTASAPLVLAQQVPPTDAPADPTAAPVVRTVGCQILFNDPTANCPLDENGFITLPDGSKAPVVVEPDGTVFIVGEDDTLTVIGQGTSFIDNEGPTGGQYDNAQEEPQAPAPPAGEQSS